MQQYDVVVIGSGPGGYVAAIRASQLGLKVAIVERAEMGGVCLNWGCIPTKALLKAAELKRAVAHAADFGLKVKDEGLDFAKIIGRSRDVAAQLSKGISFLMKKNKIEVIKGEAKFKTDKVLEVAGVGEVGFGHAIIATGARAKQIPGVLEADGKHIWTAREAMVPAELPATLLIIVGGAIGVEFASFYAALGCQVTLCEAQHRIVPAEDEEISALLHKALEKEGMKILINAKVANLKATKTGVSADINGKAESFDRAILAIGVVGNVEGLNLPTPQMGHSGKASGGMVVEKGAIVVNDYYQTGVPHLYAIGDVAGAPWLAHVASHEGVIAAEHIAHTLGKGAKPHPMDYTNIPGCTYCTPQVASTGYTEAAAKEAGHKVKVGRFNYQANGKALAMGEPVGLVKVIFDEATGALLGAHIIGAEATEMISTFVLGRSMEAVEADFLHACLPHPTLSEMIGEAVLNSEGRALNA
ncbi:MAG: dihydrolipoyl dehydrogenase [Alphaproteobacteria bacterium]|nr:dihydrolipoyl dehydrogenase [Alphaproteobacteria bacterium]